MFQVFLVNKVTCSLSALLYNPRHMTPRQASVARRSREEIFLTVKDILIFHFIKQYVNIIKLLDKGHKGRSVKEKQRGFYSFFFFTRMHTKVFQIIVAELLLLPLSPRQLSHCCPHNNPWPVRIHHWYYLPSKDSYVRHPLANTLIVAMNCVLSS